jgi:hypothetical protein
MTTSGKIVGLLTLDRFPYPVALYTSRDYELGEFIAVDAFDVPEDDVLAVSQRLNALLPLDPELVVLGTAYGCEESAERRQRVPAHATWFGSDPQSRRQSCRA